MFSNKHLWSQVSDTGFKYLNSTFGKYRGRLVILLYFVENT